MTTITGFDGSVDLHAAVRFSYSARHLHTHNKLLSGKQHFRLSPGLVFFVTSGSLNSTPSGRIYLNRKSRAARPEALSGAVKASRPTKL
jgi:hypothetical protein